MFIYVASPDPRMARLGLVISSRMYLQSLWITHNVQQVECTELQEDLIFLMSSSPLEFIRIITSFCTPTDAQVS